LANLVQHEADGPTGRGALGAACFGLAEGAGRAVGAGGSLTGGPAGLVQAVVRACSPVIPC
jgi:hypothetical protein